MGELLVRHRSLWIAVPFGFMSLGDPAMKKLLWTVSDSRTVGL
jgi:hypothetical protein